MVVEKQSIECVEGGDETNRRWSIKRKRWSRWKTPPSEEEEEVANERRWGRTPFRRTRGRRGNLRDEEKRGIEATTCILWSDERHAGNEPPLQTEVTLSSLQIPKVRRLEVSFFFFLPNAAEKKLTKAELFIHSKWSRYNTHHLLKFKCIIHGLHRFNNEIRSVSAVSTLRWAVSRIWCWLSVVNLLLARLTFLQTTVHMCTCYGLQNISIFLQNVSFHVHIMCVWPDCRVLGRWRRRWWSHREKAAKPVTAAATSSFFYFPAKTWTFSTSDRVWLQHKYGKWNLWKSYIPNMYFYNWVAWTHVDATDVSFIHL